MHARVSLHGEARVKQSSTGVADMCARLRVNRQQVLAMYSSCLERRATHRAHERPTSAMNRLVIRQMTLHVHMHSQHPYTARMCVSSVPGFITTVQYVMYFRFCGCRVFTR